MGTYVGYGLDFVPAVLPLDVLLGLGAEGAQAAARVATAPAADAWSMRRRETPRVWPWVETHRKAVGAPADAPPSIIVDGKFVTVP